MAYSSAGGGRGINPTNSAPWIIIIVEGFLCGALLPLERMPHHSLSHQALWLTPCNHSLIEFFLLWIILVSGIFLSLLIFLSIAGNILVCLAIYTERSLRRIGNLFLASLAIADLFVASLVMTFAGVNDLLGMFASNHCSIRFSFSTFFPDRFHPPIPFNRNE